MNAPRKITEDQMYEALGQAFQGDPEQSVLWQLTQRVTDPLQPEDGQGRWRIHSLVLAAGILAIVVIGTFLYFGVFYRE
jgi:hypothetical protein